MKRRYESGTIVPLLENKYQVIEAVNGQEGIELAEQERPGLILMDLSLPVMNGWEATRRLKANPDLSSIPVIALTAHAMKGDREWPWQADATIIWSNPWTKTNSWRK